MSTEETKRKTISRVDAFIALSKIAKLQSEGKESEAAAELVLILDLVIEDSDGEIVHDLFKKSMGIKDDVKDEKECTSKPSIVLWCLAALSIGALGSYIAFGDHNFSLSFDIDQV